MSWLRGPMTRAELRMARSQRAPGERMEDPASVPVTSPALPSPIAATPRELSPASPAIVTQLAPEPGDVRAVERSFAGQDIALVGDFNLPSQRSWVWGEFAPAGFAVPPALADEPGSDLARGKRYDRFLWKSRTHDRFTDQAGALDFYRGSHRELFPGRRLTRDAFTFQLSDHLPLWVEVATRA